MVCKWLLFPGCTGFLYWYCLFQNIFCLDMNLYYTGLFIAAALVHLKMFIKYLYFGVVS